MTRGPLHPVPVTGPTVMCVVQTLSAAACIKHGGAEGVARGQFGVIEIVGWIVSHAKLVHISPGQQLGMWPDRTRHKADPSSFAHVPRSPCCSRLGCECGLADADTHAIGSPPANLGGERMRRS